MKAAQAKLADGEVDLIQSAVSASWSALERDALPPVAHFAQINQKDGFFLVGRRPDLGKLTLLRSAEVSEPCALVHVAIAVPCAIASSRVDVGGELAVPDPGGPCEPVDEQQRWFARATLGLVGLDVDPLGLDEDLVALDRLHHRCSSVLRVVG